MSTRRPGGNVSLMSDNALQITVDPERLIEAQSIRIGQLSTEVLALQLDRDRLVETCRTLQETLAQMSQAAFEAAPLTSRSTVLEEHTHLVDGVEVPDAPADASAALE